MRTRRRHRSNDSYYFVVLNIMKIALERTNMIAHCYVTKNVSAALRKGHQGCPLLPLVIQLPCAEEEETGSAISHCHYQQAPQESALSRPES